MATIQKLVKSVDLNALWAKSRANQIINQLSGFAMAGVLVLSGTWVAKQFGYSFVCPFLHLTGWQCPFCGSTRAAVALINGDLWQAWKFNQLLVVGLGVGLLVFALEIICVLTKIRMAWWRKFRDKITQNQVYLVVGVIAAIFMFWRNLA